MEMQLITTRLKTNPVIIFCGFFFPPTLCTGHMHRDSKIFVNYSRQLKFQPITYTALVLESLFKFKY